MSLSLVLGCLWVVAATVTAFLPMRRQMVPGVALLAAAPVLVCVLTWQHGWITGALALFAVLSMFRRPLIHLAGWLANRRGRA